MRHAERDASALCDDPPQEADDHEQHEGSRDRPRGDVGEEKGEDVKRDRDDGDEAEPAEIGAGGLRLALAKEPQGGGEHAEGYPAQRAGVGMREQSRTLERDKI